MFGGEGNDWMAGQTGSDAMHGGAGDDLMYGDDKAGLMTEADSGQDLMWGDAGQDRMFGGAKDDVIDGGADNDKLYGEAGNDLLLGGAGDDELSGNEDNDMLDGGTGNDRLLGGAGNDTLIGGQGQDQLEGGAGDDTYVVQLGDDAGTTTTISDTEGVNTLQINAGTLSDMKLSGKGTAWTLHYSQNDTVQLNGNFQINWAGQTYKIESFAKAMTDAGGDGGSSGSGIPGSGTNKGATTRRARARKAEQRRQRTAALPTRVRSAFTQKVMGFVCEILSVHQVLPAEVSGQLRFLGLMPPPAGSLPPCPARSTWQIASASCATFELASTDVAWISHASHPHVFFRRHQDREHALISSSPQSPGSTPSDNSPAA